MSATSLELTSVPSWAIAPHAQPADPLGREFTILAVGDGTEAVVAQWKAELAGSSVAVHRVPDAQQALQLLEQRYATATVGWRVMVAGSVADCLTVRAAALALGVTDDELTIGSTSTRLRPVLCVHCDEVTTTDVAIDEVAVCAGCGRNLLVYHHVSRLRGAFLGYMVDAESPAGQEAQR